MQIKVRKFRESTLQSDVRRIVVQNPDQARHSPVEVRHLVFAKSSAIEIDLDPFGTRVAIVGVPILR